MLEAAEGRHFQDPNTFGTDEYVKLCRKLGCEPYICTNAGSGSAEEMSDWVEYCNMVSEVRWAKWRIANGYQQPHGVKYWSIGNDYRNEGGKKFIQSTLSTSSTYSVRMTDARAGHQVYCVIMDAEGQTVQSDVATLGMR